MATKAEAYPTPERRFSRARRRGNGADENPRRGRGGIGLKEMGGELTDQICFRVYVSEKKRRGRKCRRKRRVPATVQGFPTDVLKVYNPKPAQAFVELRDLSEHRPLKGGIALSTQVMTEKHHEFGTLGWFATKVSDGSTVVLTNAHVLWPDLWNGMPAQVLTDPDKLAQPIYDKTCCCEYHLIGQRIIGIKNNNVDCAIGSLTEEIPAFTIGNRSTNRTLRVDGQDVAAVGDPVRKSGRAPATRGNGDDMAASRPDPLPVGHHQGPPEHLSSFRSPPTSPTSRHMASPLHEEGTGVLLIETDNHWACFPATRATRTVVIANHIDRCCRLCRTTGTRSHSRIASGNQSGISAEFRRRRRKSFRSVREVGSPLRCTRHRDEVHSVEHRPAVQIPGTIRAGVRRGGESQSSRSGYRIPREIEG